MSYDAYLIQMQNADPDDYYLPQPRCGCGAFLTWKPTEVREDKYPEWNTIYKEDGTEDFEPAGFYIEHTPVWQCKKCGKLNLAGDI